MARIPAIPIMPYLDLSHEQRSNRGRLAKYPTMLSAFQAKVEVRGGDECWPWSGRTLPSGYGVLTVWSKGRAWNFLAHRVAKVIAEGRELTTEYLCHTCGNPPCCNPSHLYEGTARTNHVDAVKHGAARSIGDVLRGIRGASHPRSLYTTEQRLEAIRLWSVDKLSMYRISKALGCHRGTISRWIREAFPEAF
jgi:hypothetical protein